MRFQVALEPVDDGGYVARCEAPAVSATGPSPASALDELRAALRYQLEYCPCRGIDPSTIDFDLDS